MYIDSHITKTGQELSVSRVLRVGRGKATEGFGVPIEDQGIWYVESIESIVGGTRRKRWVEGVTYKEAEEEFRDLSNKMFPDSDLLF